jgi:predicted transglutaminase-like cysteine proteinase
MAASLALTLGACAEQSVPSSTSMQLGAATLAPRGYLQFCLRRPDQCGLRTPLTEIKDAALQAALNREEWTNVLSVGRGVPAAADVAVASKAAAPVQPTTQEVALVDDKAPIAVEGLAGLESIASPTVDIQPTPLPSAPRQNSIAAATSVTAPTLEQLFQHVQRSAEAAALHYGPRLWQHLEAVNAEINARIKPRTDEEAFGVDDYWTLPLDNGGRAEGNCKHYALEKRRMLIEAGMSEDVLSLAIVRTPQGETHAVLVVATDRGDFVLDNLTPDIRGWRESGYTWLSRQTPGAPLRWAAIDPIPRVGV